MDLDARHRLALELHRAQAQRVVKSHPLRQLFWECTLRCNLNCRHCGSDCKHVSAVKDMPKEDFLRVLDEVRRVEDSHKVMVILTGGEPLMRTDLEECGRAIYEKEFPWGMVSNGLALTRTRLDGLLASGLRAITISLDGLEEEHEWMRGVPGSFARAANAIEMVSATPDLVSDVVTCVNRHNYDKLPEIREFLWSIGVTAWRLFTVFPVGRAAQDPELQLSREQFRGLMEFIKSSRKKGLNISYGCEGFLCNYEGEVRDHFFFCRAGVTVGSVLADGAISSCPSIRADYYQGNIYKDNFMDVWENRFQPYRDRKWMRTGECADCKWFRYCLGNGMHLRDENGALILCHMKRM